VIDADITRARTLPAAFYRDPAMFAAVRERVIARSWHLVDAAVPAGPGSVAPFRQIAGCEGEPLLLTRDAAGALRCLSNVCTHRGNLVCSAPGAADTLRCRYHGRRFGLDGRFLAMPEFAGVADFPAAADDLPALPLASFGPLLFTAIDPLFAFDELIAPLCAQLAGLPLERLAFDPAGSRDYQVAASWALYVDNYLEGFHIPFVHPELARSIEYASYSSELHPYAVLQVADSAPGEPAFAGTSIAACYWFLFPTTMLNFYPWGLSINIVVPLAVDRTRVVYRTWLWDEAARGRGAGGALDRVEMQDQEIVEAVQHGMSSRLYSRGRYSPTRERGVHHFHRLLARFLPDIQ
jgi:choline monooxygenase